MNKKRAEELVNEYYKNNPQPIELTPEQYWAICIGIAAGTAVSIFFEERRLKKRIRRLEDRVDNMNCKGGRCYEN